MEYKGGDEPLTDGGRVAYIVTEGVYGEGWMSWLSGRISGGRNVERQRRMEDHLSWSFCQWEQTSKTDGRRRAPEAAAVMSAARPYATLCQDPYKSIGSFIKQGNGEDSTHHATFGDVFHGCCRSGSSFFFFPIVWCIHPPPSSSIFSISLPLLASPFTALPSLPPSHLPASSSCPSSHSLPSALYIPPTLRFTLMGITVTLTSEGITANKVRRRDWQPRTLPSRLSHLMVVMVVVVVLRVFVSSTSMLVAQEEEE